MLYKRLGYIQNLGEIFADEAEWFVAVDLAFSRARKALEKVRGQK